MSPDKVLFQCKNIAVLFLYVVVPIKKYLVKVLLKNIHALMEKKKNISMGLFLTYYLYIMPFKSHNAI